MARYKATTLLCPTQIACDGAVLVRGGSMCAKCRDKLEARTKAKSAGPIRLKGEVRHGK